MGYAQPNLAMRLLRWLIIFGVLSGIGYAVWHVFQHETRPKTIVSLGQTAFRVDVAKTDRARQKGLAGRTKLARGEGMLFVFDQDGDHTIWMKDMKIPIDIIWLDKHKKVIYIEREVEPDAEPYEVYGAPKHSRYVLELASGQAKRSKIVVGQTAKFNMTEEDS